MNIIMRFNMVDCNPCATPFQFGLKLTKIRQTPIVDATIYRQLFDNIIYLTHNRPDITFFVSMVS
jgi:hypothetical protein